MPYQNKSEQFIKKKNERDCLAQHLKMNRMRVSQTVAELIQYCNGHQQVDPLIYPVKENPFKEKKTCDII